MSVVRRLRRPTALISGAGVAGPALAYWLLRAGVAPVLVETASAPREGGYMIDFWGLGFEVAERMGLDRRLRQAGYRIEELRLVDAKGRTDARLPVERFVSVFGDRYVSLLRGDLAAMLLGEVADHVEVLFGDEVVGLAQDAEGVDVTFRRAAARRFDLVFGADGLHSNIRRLTFGPHSEFERALGYYAAAFTTSGYPHRDESAYVSRTIPGRQAARYALRDGRTTIFMILTADLASGRPLTTCEEQRSFLEEAFAGIGWEERSIRLALDGADDLYFDTVSQVKMPGWSRGRVCLVGDAAYCPSLLAGEGASFGMAGALIVAGELARAMGDHRPAFDMYERRLRAFIERKQRGALRMGAWFAPRTAVGVAARNAITRLAGLPGLSRLVSGAVFDDRFVLPRYEWCD